MTSGIYLHDGFVFEPREDCPFYWDLPRWRAYVDQLAAHGVHIMEFCTQAAFLRIPSTDFEHRRIKIMQEMIRYAHRKSLKVWLILAANVLSSVPEGELPVDQRDPGAFCEPCPRQPGIMSRLKEVTEHFVRAYREADGFEIFGGDWGGCTCGECDYTTWMELAREYIAIVRRYNPAALVSLNTWCVSYWRSFIPGDRDNWPEVFRMEAETSMKVAAAMDRMPEGTALTLPFHHLYRPLALDGRTPEEFPCWPDAAMIAGLRAKGHPVYAWPHFVMENDPYHMGRWGSFNARVRYIGDVVRRLHRLGADGIIGNLYSPVQQPLSAYALARFCREPGLEAEGILKDFAGLAAVPESADALYRALLYLENSDPWEKDLGEAARLRKLPGAADGKQEALRLLSGVKPARENAFMTLSPDILANIRAAITALQP